MASNEINAAPIFDVPHLDNITIDGVAGDWGERGFCVGVLGDWYRKLKPVADLDVAFRLGWDERGLLVLLRVTDDVYEESDTEIWNKDSIEIFYAPERGSRDIFQVLISPGMDPKHPEMRLYLHDGRTTESLKKIEASATAVRTKTADGYIMEVLLPWKNLAIKPETGREIAFQIFVNDTDGGPRFQALWYPNGNPNSDTMKMHRLRLADKPSPPVNALVTTEYERFRRVRIHVAGTTDFIGKSLTVKEGDRELGSIKVVPESGRAGGTLHLPMPAAAKAYGPLSLHLEGKHLQAVDLADPREARAKAFMRQPFVFDLRSAFFGPIFPKCDFEQPSYVEDLIGPYTIAMTYYDADYNPVNRAEKPGRYGAVIEIKTEAGETFRRFRTLFRTPELVQWWLKDIAASLDFPEGTGINPVVAREQTRGMGKHLKSLLTRSFLQDSLTPALMAGLHETKPGAEDASVAEDFQAIDRQWWVGLKRKLIGADKIYPDTFVCPKPLAGKAANTIREGTLAEAGMKPDAAKKIDAVLTEWSADTDQPFVVCIARHGVVVLHKAYGQRDGKPLTVGTSSWMASATKPLSGMAIMSLVSQGLVSLDDPVSKFLPSFRRAKVATPLTIRHLFTHTTGLTGHWGDDMNDFDDILAAYYPHMAIGKKCEYNGTSLALGCKIVEMITGEALPQFYKRHFLDPLGCKATDVADSSGDAWSIPMDFAKIGQVLLNRGSYGDKEFISEKVFSQMLPERLTKVLGPDTKTEWGIGLIWCRGEGLGEGTFGHGAASGATFRVDPTNDLVIIMTRNAWGRNADKYNPRFLAEIVAGIAEA